MRSRLRMLGCAIAASALIFGAVAATAADPRIDAELIDADVNAAKGNALIQVTVLDVDLIDADEAGGTPRNGQGHLHYRVDDGPVIATSAKKLAFHELQPGEHRIHVALVGNDHKPIGPEETVKVMIPTAVLAH
jgi:hypothetical protein